MLALGTYLLSSLVFWRESYIISYKRGLLFYYWYVGFSRASDKMIDNGARAFFMFVHERGGSCLRNFVKLDCWTLLINYLLTI